MFPNEGFNKPPLAGPARCAREYVGHPHAAVTARRGRPSVDTVGAGMADAPRCSWMLAPNLKGGQTDDLERGRGYGNPRGFEIPQDFATHAVPELADTVIRSDARLMP